MTAAVQRTIPPHASNEFNVAGLRPELVERPTGIAVLVIADAVFGAPRKVLELSAAEARELGRKCIALADQIETRK